MVYSAWQWVLLGVAPLSALLTWGALQYARRRNLVDEPGERRSHRVSTPRGGGVGVVLALLAAFVAGAWYWPAARLELLVFSSGLLMVAGIGWWDDHRPLSAALRLVVHVVASVLLGFLILQATGSWLMAGCAVIFTVSLINAWNFMDGINGLATSQAIVVSAALAGVLSVPLALFGGAIALACLGFLPFNFPRARIFLGDVGSGALGYLVAGVFCLAAVHAEISVGVLLLPLLAFLGDAGLTLFKRIVTGQRWMEPHTQHLYQRLARSWGGHARVTAAYAMFTLSGGCLLHYFKDFGQVMALFALFCGMLVAVVCWLFLGKEQVH